MKIQKFMVFLSLVISCGRSNDSADETNPPSPEIPPIVDEQVQYNDSYLLNAINEDNPDKASLALKNGVDPNTSYSSGLALEIAIEKQSAKVIKVLIEAGASFDIFTETTGAHPLVFSYDLNKLEAFKTILGMSEGGADIAYGETTLIHHALEHKMEDYALLLTKKLPDEELSKFRFNKKLSLGETASYTYLHLAAKYDAVFFLEHILERNIFDLDQYLQPAKEKMTALDFSLVNLSAKAIDLLLAHGATIKLDCSPSAIDTCFPRKLLVFGSEDLDGAERVAKILQILFDKSLIKPNMEIGESNLLIETIVLLKDQTPVKVLIENGADPHLKGRAEFDAFHFAQNYPEIMEVLDGASQ